VSSFCLGCGNSLAGGERFCATCGRDSQAGAAVPPVDPAVAFGLPPDTSGKAIFSLVCGILFLILPFSIPAVIFGHLSLYDIRRSGGRLTGRGLAITGIILGYLGMALLVGFIGLTIYEARLAQKRIANRVQVEGENSVVTSVRTLNTAEIAYSQAHPKVGYTCSLLDLRAAWGISEDLAAGHKNGYTFKLQGCAADKAVGPIVKYQLLASPWLDPAMPGKAAAPAFCSDQSDVIRIAPNGSAQDCLKTGVDLSVKDITHPKVIVQASPQ